MHDNEDDPGYSVVNSILETITPCVFRGDIRSQTGLVRWSVKLSAPFISATFRHFSAAVKDLEQRSNVVYVPIAMIRG